MKLIKAIVYGIVSVLLSSCSTYKLDEKDIKLNPYKVDDVLIFRNNFNEYDTVLITEINSYINPTDPLSFWGDRTEALTVTARHNDPSSNPSN